MMIVIIWLVVSNMAFIFQHRPAMAARLFCIWGWLTTNYWLVVSNMAFIFHNIWVVILPIDELILFRGVETTNQ